jgi:hypothetical protein
MRVLAFKPNPRKPEQGFVRLTEMVDVQTEDGRKEQVEGEIIEAWTPELSKIPDLIGKELPDGWTLRDGPKGKQLLPPKEGRGGGPTAFRNTKEAFLLEQASIHASVALQQAVILLTSNTKDSGQHFGGDIEAWTKRFYHLLQSVSEGPSVGMYRGASVSAAGAVTTPIVSAQGPPSDTISDEQSPLSSTEGAATSSEDRREGDAGDSAVKPKEAVQTPGSPSRRQRCLHPSIKTITKETGGSVDVCEKCGVVVST